MTISDQLLQQECSLIYPPVASDTLDSKLGDVALFPSLAAALSYPWGELLSKQKGESRVLSSLWRQGAFS